MFIDTHCHLNIMVNKKPDELLTELQLDEIKQIVHHASRAHISHIINVGTSAPESENCVMIARAIPNVFATVGVHPTDCNEEWQSQFEVIKKLVREKEANKIVAIGETGLDYYHPPLNKQRQKDAFKAHIELALEHNLPLVVHVREAADDVLEVLSEYVGQARGVNHCFLQQKYVADQFIEWGWYLGIDAPITYPKNEWFRELVMHLPLENLILETDAPFLPPQQFRGKQNSPAYIPLFAQVIAELKGVSLEEVGRVTSANAKTLFGF